MTLDEFFDDLRLLTADCVNQMGGGLSHAQQACEAQDNGNHAGSIEEWEEAALIFEHLSEMAGELEQICQKAKEAAIIAEGGE